jgi:uncharacterized membrane protein
MKLGSTAFVSLVVIAAIALGVYLRVADLDRQIYFEDEVWLSIRVAGHTYDDWVRTFFDGGVHEAAALKQYQRIAPNTDVAVTVQAQAIDDAKWPPLYHVIARGWERCFGASPGAMRSLSALIGLLLLPAVYWLCFELFESRLVGGVAMAIVAVSPLHVAYAREARPYVLFVLLAVLSTATLLRALRRDDGRTWLGYAALLLLGFYSDLMFVWIAIGHGLYVAFIERWRLTVSVRRYLAALVPAALLFVPWLWTMFHHNWNDGLGWVSGARSPLSSLKEWSTQLGRAFVDLHLAAGTAKALTVAILLVVAAGIYSLSRAAPRVWLLLLFFALPTVVALIVIDARSQTHFALIPRYMLAPWLAFEIAIAYLLASALTASRAARLVGAMGLTLFVFAGTLSSLAVVRASTAPDAAYNADLEAIATIVDGASHPLIITEDGPDVAHILANLLRDDVMFQLVPTGAHATTPVASGYTVFALDPSPSLRQKLESRGFRLQRVFGIDVSGHVWQDSLWRISRG